MDFDHPKMSQLRTQHVEMQVSVVGHPDNSWHDGGKKIVHSNLTESVLEQLTMASTSGSVWGAPTTPKVLKRRLSPTSLRPPGIGGIMASSKSTLLVSCTLKKPLRGAHDENARSADVCVFTADSPPACQTVGFPTHNM